MKYILSILIFCSIFMEAKAQPYPQSNGLGAGSATTLYRQLGAIIGEKGIITAVYPDTTTANAGYIDFYPGAIIGTQASPTDSLFVWMRNINSTKWIKINVSGGGGGSGVCEGYMTDVFIKVPTDSVFVVRCETDTVFAYKIGLPVKYIVDVVVDSALNAEVYTYNDGSTYTTYFEPIAEPVPPDTNFVRDLYERSDSLFKHLNGVEVFVGMLNGASGIVDSNFVRTIYERSDSLFFVLNGIETFVGMLGGGSGAVESVTGTMVDNTDPANPVVGIQVADGITITGTGEIGNPFVAVQLDTLDKWPKNVFKRGNDLIVEKNGVETVIHTFVKDTFRVVAPLYLDTVGALVYLKLDESNLVHKTGNETIAGQKTFSNRMYLDSLPETTSNLSSTISTNRHVTKGIGDSLWKPTIYPEQDYVQTISWPTGTPPTGTPTIRWWGQREGGMMHLFIFFTYPTEGTGISSFVIPMPTGAPAPLVMTGTQVAAGVHIYSGTGTIARANGTTQRNLSLCHIQYNASATGFEIFNGISSSTVKIGTIAIVYPISP